MLVLIYENPDLAFIVAMLPVEHQRDYMKVLFSVFF